EAMACGLPVVISKVAGAAELVTHGRDGYLIENPRDPQEIAQYIGRLIADHSLRSSMGESARKLAEGHTWDFVAQEYHSAIVKFELANRL
ncbi:MAG: glycosyltransferase, partial [Bdellovibrionota bacterium]